MLINSDNLRALYQNFNTNYIRGFTQRPVLFRDVAMEVPSSTTEEIHHWLAQLPQLARMLGPRTIRQIAIHDYRLSNEPFGLDAEIPVDLVEDDQYNTLAQVPEQFGLASAQFPDDFMFAKLEDGTDDACWDGEAFFSGSHPNDFDRASAGTYRNYYDGTVAGGGVAYPLTQANVQFGLATQAAYVGESGRPLGLGVAKRYLVVPPALELTADEICKGPAIQKIVENQAGTDNVAASAPSNMLQNKLTPLVIDRLTDDEAWYIVAVMGNLKPLIYQNRKAPQYQMITDPQHPRVYQDRKIDHFVRARAGFGFSLPQLCLKFSPAT